MYSDSINTAYFYYVGMFKRTTNNMNSTRTTHPSPCERERERVIYPFKYSL